MIPQKVVKTSGTDDEEIMVEIFFPTSINLESLEALSAMSPKWRSGFHIHNLLEKELLLKLSLVRKYANWWWNQCHLKKYESKWVHLPQFSG